MKKRINLILFITYSLKIKNAIIEYFEKSLVFENFQR